MFWFCRFFGIAPYQVIRNKMNQIIDLKLSPSMCVYSVIFIISCTFLSNYGLWYDSNSGHPLRYQESHSNHKHLHSIIICTYTDEILFFFQFISIFLVSLVQLSFIISIYLFHRMKSITYRFVFFMDMNTVSASLVVNGLVAIISFKHTRRANQLLQKV